MLARLGIVILCGVWLALSASGVRAEEPPVVLDVPYRSQFDGSPYEDANCGPASMAMALQAYGIWVSTAFLREQVNKLAGNWSYDSGTWIVHMEAILDSHRLNVADLSVNEKLYVWSLEDVRRHVRAGHPVIPEVFFPDLPGHEQSTYVGDHFIVIVGLQGQDFVYHDSAFRDRSGAFRTISAKQLQKAWQRSDFPFAALAIAPALGKSPVGPRSTPTPTVTPTRTPTATPTPTPTATAVAPTPTATPAPSPVATTPAPSSETSYSAFFGVLFLVGMVISIARTSRRH